MYTGPPHQARIFSERPAWVRYNTGDLMPSSRSTARVSASAVGVACLLAKATSWEIAVWSLMCAVASALVLVLLVWAAYGLFDRPSDPPASHVVDIPDSCYVSEGSAATNPARAGNSDGSVKVLSWNTWCIPVYGTDNPSDYLEGPDPSKYTTPRCITPAPRPMSQLTLNPLFTGLITRLTTFIGRWGLLTRILAPPMLDKKPHGRAVSDPRTAAR